MKTTLRSIRSWTLALALAALSCLRVEAQTWDGGDANNYWTNALNWVGDLVPGSNGAILFNNTSALNLDNTLGAAFTVNSLTFSAAQIAAVTINTITNFPLTFNPGTVLTVNAGSHKFIGTAAGATRLADVFFNAVTMPTLSVSRSGDVLTFSWPAASSHYRLQAQTNTLDAGIGGAWFDYPGGATSPVNVTMNPANPTVFYRLATSGPVYTFDVATGASFEFAGRLGQSGTETNFIKNYIKTGGGTLFLASDNGGGLGWMSGGHTMTVNQGILKMGQRARGNSGMKIFVPSGSSLQVLGEEAIPNGSVSLAGNGVSGNGALEFVGGLNTAGNGTNRIETTNVILTANASIGAVEGGQLNKGNLIGAFTMTKVGLGELELGNALYNTTWAAIVVSSGTLKVSGALTNTGGGPTAPATIASGGVLRVTASFGRYDGNITVQSGGKLEGTGTINGTVTVDGELAPGVGSTTPSILTVNNALTLGAGSTTSVQVSGASSDQVAGLTSVTFGGTLNVTEITAPVSGQTYQLFNIGGGGSFTVTGTPSIGGTWSFDPATGVLTHVL